MCLFPFGGVFFQDHGAEELFHLCLKGHRIGHGNVTGVAGDQGFPGTTEYAIDDAAVVAAPTVVVVGVGLFAPPLVVGQPRRRFEPGLASKTGEGGGTSVNVSAK